MKTLVTLVVLLWSSAAFAAPTCGPGSATTDAGCNAAANVPVGNNGDFCHMSDIGFGDCTCDLTQDSGNPAFHGVIDCGSGLANDLTDDLNAALLDNKLLEEENEHLSQVSDKLKGQLGTCSAEVSAIKDLIARLPAGIQKVIAIFDARLHTRR